MDCFGTYFTHVQTCDDVRVQSATEWTASGYTLHMSKTCDDIRVQSATEWTASVHTLHMSKPVMTFVSKVLRNGLLRCILYTTYTLHMSKPVMTFVSKVLRNGMLRYILYTCPNL